MRELREAINKIVNPLQTDTQMDMEVVSVNEAERTAQCKTLSTDAEVTITVRLMPAVDDGIFVVPKVGSTVTVNQSGQSEPIVIGFTETDRIELRGGQFEGLVKVAQLTTKLNNLENKVNSIITAYNAHVHPGVTSGPSSTAITPAVVTGTLTPTQQTEIENDKITHG